MYKLREIREKQGLTLVELAEKSEVSKSQISAVELGDHDLTVGNLIRLSLALETTPNDIIGWEDIKENEKRRTKWDFNS